MKVTKRIRIPYMCFQEPFLGIYTDEHFKKKKATSYMPTSIFAISEQTKLTIFLATIFDGSTCPLSLSL